MPLISLPLQTTTIQGIQGEMGSSKASAIPAAAPRQDPLMEDMFLWATNQATLVPDFHTAQDPTILPDAPTEGAVAANDQQEGQAERAFVRSQRMALASEFNSQGKWPFPFKCMYGYSLARGVRYLCSLGAASNAL